MQSYTNVAITIKNSHINANFLTIHLRTHNRESYKFIQDDNIFLYTTWGHTLMIDHVKVANVTRLSCIIQFLTFIWEFILGRDHFNAVSVVWYFYKNAILKPYDDAYRWSRDDLGGYPPDVHPWVGYIWSKPQIYPSPIWS